MPGITTMLVVDPEFDPDIHDQQEVVFHIPGGESQAKRLFLHAFVDCAGLTVTEVISDPVEPKAPARVPRTHNRRRRRGT